MTFEEMLPHLRAGKPVTREAWCNTWGRHTQHMWYKWFPKDNPEPILCFLFSQDGLRAPDLEATDWKIYERYHNDRPGHQDPTPNANPV